MNEKLRAAMEELRDELRKIGEEHPELIKLQEKTVHALDAGGHLPVVEELREAAERFEVRYPRLTAVLNNAMNSLSNIGI